MKVTIHNIDVTKFVTAFDITRTNDLSAGMSAITANMTVINRIETALTLKRCYRVVVSLLPALPDLVLEIGGFTAQTDGTIVLVLTQLDQRYYQLRPIYSTKQLDAKQPPMSRGAIIADIFNDFGVPHSISGFGDLQYDLAGSNESDPISTASGLAVNTGYIMYVNTANTSVYVDSYNQWIVKPPVADGNVIKEIAATTPPSIDKVIIAGTNKKEIANKKKGEKIEEISRSIFGSIEERTVTTIEPNGDETSQTDCMLKLVRPDTHPTSSLMIIKSQSKKRTYSDSEGRITGYIKETKTNTAVIAPEATDNNLLIPAERVVYAADFIKSTNELTSTVESTYQVHVIGRQQLVKFKPSGLERIKPRTYTIKSPDAVEAPLTPAEENEQIISPLVLTKRVRTSYSKIGTNQWVERVTVTEREVISETKGTDGAKNESQEVKRLGGMKTTQDSSRIVTSMPTVQTLPNDEPEIEEKTSHLTFMGDLVPHICGVLRTERIDLAGTVSPVYLPQAGKLQAIPRLNNTVGINLIITANSLLLLLKPYAKLNTGKLILMPVDLSFNFDAYDEVEFAGTFLVLCKSTKAINRVIIPPPFIINTPTVKGAIQLPIYHNQVIGNDTITPELIELPKPTKSIATGNVQTPVINVPDSFEETETVWRLPSTGVIVAPIISSAYALPSNFMVNIQPSLQPSTLAEIEGDTLIITNYFTPEYYLYGYVDKPTIHDVIYASSASVLYTYQYMLS